MFRVPPPLSRGDQEKLDKIRRLIDGATSDLLISSDWSINMQLVDEINHCTNRVVIEEAVRIIRKKLAHKRIRVAIFAVTLTEALVKNCSFELHQAIATPNFMNALASLARKHTHRPSNISCHCAEKVLDLIQSWGEAFLPQRQELPLFVNTYHKLRKEGLLFPQQYSDRSPVLNPVGPGSLLDHQGEIEVQIAQAHERNAEEYNLNGSSRHQSLRHTPNERRNQQEREGSSSNLDLPHSFSEKLAAASTLAETLKSMIEASDSAAALRRDDIISELFRQGKQTALPAIVNLIQERVEASPQVLQPVLDVKDALDSAFVLYEQAISGEISLPVMKVPQQQNIGEKEDLLSSCFDSSVTDNEVSQPDVVVPSSTFRQTTKKGGGGVPVPKIPSYEKSTITSGTSNAAALPAATPVLDGNTHKTNPDKKKDAATTKVQNLLENLGSLYAAGGTLPTPALAPAPLPLPNDYSSNNLEVNASLPPISTFASYEGSGGALLDCSQQQSQVQVLQPQSHLVQQDWQGHPTPQLWQERPFQEGCERQYTQWPSMYAHNENISQAVLGQGGQLGQQQVVPNQQGPLMYPQVEPQQTMQNPQLHQSMGQQTPSLYGSQPVQQQYAQQAHPEQPVQSVQQQHVQQPISQQPVPQQQQPGQVKQNCQHMNE